ncbi:hypothetical protein LENED_002634 [Lentinula edodes]|uniref:DUF6589 domain-containing protein n=1 Tax=Lentinula edodes TaxID=5353 RepID=A0A1Q3E1T1_LENED|nr:hypothetical protein LENED_002634 [Lentinula edodes]
MLYEKYCKLAPFTTTLLRIFTASPNRYQQRKSANKDKSSDSESNIEMEDVQSDGSPDQSGRLEDTFIASGDIKTEADAQNTESLDVTEAAITLVIAMLTFLRNRATNFLPLLLGLFFMINGTSTRVMIMLNAVGITVSARTVERLKEELTKSAINFAIDLIASPALWYIIYDNINIYQKKWDQRITNRNEMIHATNSAVIGIDGDGIDTDKVSDLHARLEKRGQRANANFNTDIMPTNDDLDFIQKSSLWLISDLLLRYTPGSDKWKNRHKMREEVDKMMPSDRPLPPKKTDTRPFGVFDINEGSKKGQVKLNEAMRKRARQTEESWVQYTAIRVGDWLTSMLNRGARRDRTNEDLPMERLDFIQELSALWHFALQATHMIMRIHHGHEIGNDPSSLGAHKTLLKRVWDASKPNYAAAKSLIRHSLIARLIHLVMVQKGYQQWDELSKWQPSGFEDLKAVAEKIRDEWATTAAAEQKKELKDDWNARSSYFIRDALLFLEFEAATRFADPGRVLRILKFWSLSFRGAGQHNYARECVEVLVQFKYETPEELQKALERAWFVNETGEEGKWIASDLYLERLNFWVKRVFIAHGDGVTIDYIVQKGSACIEVSREVSHLIANYFGNPDRSRAHKEVKFFEDLRVTVEELERLGIHSRTKERFVPAKLRANAKNPTPHSAVIDAQVHGMEIWADGNFTNYIRLTTYDPNTKSYPLGNPAKPPTRKEISENQEDEEDEENADEYDRNHATYLNSGTVFDNTEENVLAFNNYEDIEGGGSLGGGEEFSSGEIIL